MEVRKRPFFRNQNVNLNYLIMLTQWAHLRLLKFVIRFSKSCCIWNICEMVNEKIMILATDILLVVICTLFTTPKKWNMQANQTYCCWFLILDHAIYYDFGVNWKLGICTFVTKLVKTECNSNYRPIENNRN